MRFLSEYDFLVTWPVLAGSSAVYLAVVLLLWLRSSSAPKRSLTGFALVYNSAQIGLCGWMTYAFAAAAFSWDNPMALNKAYTREVEVVMLVHFLSKWLDYCDTAIMLLKHNFHQVSFLHLYHHVSIALVWGYLLQSGDANGTAYFGAFLNSFVHLLMYSHYLATSLGLRNPLKFLLTNLQMVQFGLCLVHATLVVVYERVLPSRLAYLQLAYHTVMLILFSDFRRKTYSSSRSAAPAAKSHQKSH